MRVYFYLVFILGYKYLLILWELWRLLYKYDKDFEWGLSFELMCMVVNVYNKVNVVKKNMFLNENYKLLLFLFFKWGGWKIWLKIKC